MPPRCCRELWADMRKGELWLLLLLTAATSATSAKLIRSAEELRAHGAT